MAENITMPPVRVVAEKCLEVTVQLNRGPIRLQLAEMMTPGRRVLAVVGGNVIAVSNVNEITRLIDGLYALGAAWQKQDQNPEAARGDARPTEKGDERES